MLITRVINWDQNYGFQSGIYRSPCPSAVPNNTNHRSILQCCLVTKLTQPSLYVSGETARKISEGQIFMQKGKGLFCSPLPTSYISPFILYSYFESQIKMKIKLCPKFPPFFNVGVDECQSHQLEWSGQWKKKVTLFVHPWLYITTHMTMHIFMCSILCHRKPLNPMPKILANLLTWFVNKK